MTRTSCRRLAAQSSRALCSARLPRSLLPHVGGVASIVNCRLDCFDGCGTPVGFDGSCSYAHVPHGDAWKCFECVSNGPHAVTTGHSLDAQLCSHFLLDPRFSFFAPVS